MKIKFGSLVVAGSGKIGGHVAAKNRGGAYLRTKSTPSNPQTAAQLSARALFASFSSGWALLDQAARDGFNNAVATFATTDIFGDLRNPSGLNLYVKLNANASNGGFPSVDVAPAKLELPFSLINDVTITPATGALIVTLEDSVMDGAKVIVWATPTMSDGVKFVKNNLRVIGNATVAAGAVNLATQYADKFGLPLAGANISVGVQVVNASGQTGVNQVVKAFV